MLLLLSCSDQSISPEERDFNILFRFGVGGRNELNTFQNTYTKDLILDGTRTVPLALSPDELRAIESKLVEADFFSYPDTFAVATEDSVLVSIDPHMTYFFRVRHHSIIKTLMWNESPLPTSSDPRLENLRRIVQFVMNIVEQRPEVQNLPPARGGYM